jgi:p-methyltransferase
MMIKNNYGFKWFSYFRCSNSDEEAIDLMATSGCQGVFLGIESGSPTILRNLNKAATVEKYSEGIRLLHDRGILTFGSFIVGFPGETEDTISETVHFIREAQPTYFRAQPWYCEPGTPIQLERLKYGVEGNGFAWRHATMDAVRAMDHIERMLLSINESIWLPQWCFDFWIIPYLLGKGLSTGQLKNFVRRANRLLALQIERIPEPRKHFLRQSYLKELVEEVSSWFPDESHRLERRVS